MPILYETSATGETIELAELSVIEFYLDRNPKELQSQMTEIFVGKHILEWLSVADIKLAMVLDNMMLLPGDKYISCEKIPAIIAVYN
ncbi:hypothetical protein BGZ49_005438 [Haplosporangium sp. Z 27]|nr:hypothetical protein BGZ49_005438 [Haplosporangium sp. Z 27]